MDDDGILYSLDPAESSRHAADRLRRESALWNSRFRFIAKRQEDLDAADIDDHSVDVLFMVGRHSLSSDLEAYRRIFPHLSASGLIAVHDTG